MIYKKYIYILLYIYIKPTFYCIPLSIGKNIAYNSNISKKFIIWIY